MKNPHIELNAPSTPLPQNLKTASNWFQLIPFGSFSHPNGTQQFTTSEAHAIVDHFYSPCSKILRFFYGFPINHKQPLKQNSLPLLPLSKRLWQYIKMGIPFLRSKNKRPSFQNTPKKLRQKTYGHLIKLQVHNNGLWALIQWNATGQNLIKRKIPAGLTPFWLLHTNTNHSHILTPFKLTHIELSPTPSPKNKKSPPPLNINTKSLTEDLINQKPITKNNHDRFLSLVHNHMTQTGQHYLKSWNTIKQQHPHLFQSL